MKYKVDVEKQALRESSQKVTPHVLDVRAKARILTKRQNRVVNKVEKLAIKGWWMMSTVLS